jgi:hypothetical protein
MSYAPNPEGLRSAFAAERFALEGEPLQFTLVDAGNLTVATGKVAAGDPQTEGGLPPFTQCVQNGEYPVTLALARRDNGEERIAYARVLFAATPVVHWYPALTADQDARTLALDDFFGCVIESGTACFASADRTVSFSSGLANGRYPSYFGYDATGRVAALVTDFALVPGVRQAPRPRRSWWRRLLSALK